MTADTDVPPGHIIDVISTDDSQIVSQTTAARVAGSVLVYNGDGRYVWAPPTRPKGQIEWSADPNAGIHLQTYLISLTHIKKGDAIKVDPATIIPHGNCAPTIDGQRRYYNVLAAAERATYRPVTPWPIRREFGLDPIPTHTVVVEDRSAMDAIGPLIEQHRSTLDGTSIVPLFPGVKDNHNPSDADPISAPRWTRLVSELQGMNVVAVGRFVSETLRLRQMSEGTWHRAQGFLAMRVPDVKDPFWTENGRGWGSILSLSTDEHQALGQAGAYGRIKVRALPCTGFKRF